MSLAWMNCGPTLHDKSVSAPAIAAPRQARAPVARDNADGMPATAEKQVTEWVNDAFAIVSRASGAVGPAETNLRRGLGALVRHLALSAPPIAEPAPEPDGTTIELSSDELRHVRRALDASLAIFGRHGDQLNTAQRRIQILIRACRRNADDVLQASSGPSPFKSRPAQR